MPQPVWRRALQFAGKCWVVGLDGVSGGLEEPAQDLPQAWCGDTARLVEMAEQRRVRRPACWGHRQPTLRQILVQCKARERRQDHLANLRALAGEVKPPLTTCTGFDAAECDADQLACAQAGRITEIEQKAQTLRGGNRPAMRPFEPIGNRPGQLPFASRKGARDVQFAVALRAAHPKAGERIREHVALLDQPAKHRADDRQCVGNGIRG